MDDTDTVAAAAHRQVGRNPPRLGHQQAEDLELCTRMVVLPIAQRRRWPAATLYVPARPGNTRRMRARSGVRLFIRRYLTWRSASLVRSPVALLADAVPRLVMVSVSFRAMDRCGGMCLLVGIALVLVLFSLV
jgi:hypothetical protein